MFFKLKFFKFYAPLLPSLVFNIKFYSTRFYRYFYVYMHKLCIHMLIIYNYKPLPAWILFFFVVFQDIAYDRLFSSTDS